MVSLALNKETIKHGRHTRILTAQIRRVPWVFDFDAGLQPTCWYECTGLLCEIARSTCEARAFGTFGGFGLFKHVYLWKVSLPSTNGKAIANNQFVSSDRWHINNQFERRTHIVCFPDIPWMITALRNFSRRSLSATTTKLVLTRDSSPCGFSLRPIHIVTW